MRHQIIKSLKFFQHLLFTRFHRISSQIVDTLLLLAVAIFLVFTIRTKSQMR